MGDRMPIEDALPGDLEQLVQWTMAKAKTYEVRLEDMEASFLKVPETFYCASRPALFIGPLIPKPGIDGKTLGIALVRMIKDIRKTFSGDIIYLTRGMPDGIDELAERVGFKREESAALMRLRGTHGV